MEEKLADDLIVIGYNQQAYRFIFEALLKELQKKIGSTKAELKKSLDTIDFSSNESEHNNDQKFLDEDVESIINDYLTFPETQQQENPLHYLGEDVTEEVASAYLLHRFIGSSVNADRKRNLFKSCFSGNWSLYRKALSNKSSSFLNRPSSATISGTPYAIWTTARFSMNPGLNQAASEKPRPLSSGSWEDSW